MDGFTKHMEHLEISWTHAWMNRDVATMKSLASPDFVFLLGGRDSAILDLASWLEATTSRLRCDAYKFHDIYARQHKRVALFSARMSMEGHIGRTPLTGDLWITDLWKRGRVRRSWRLVERVMSRADGDVALGQEVTRLQLWK